MCPPFSQVSNLFYPCQSPSMSFSSPPLKKTHTHLTLSTTSSPPFLPCFFPTNKCRPRVLHPTIFINSSNSNTRRFQHVHPLLPSWKIGFPGWYTHCSVFLPT